MNDIVDPRHRAAATLIRSRLAAYEDIEDLINLGAYTAGSNSKLDSAVREHEKIQEFLRQKLNNSSPLDETLLQLEALAEKV